MGSMEKPFYRRLFSRPQKPAGETPEITAAPADDGDAEVQFRRGLGFAREGAAQDYAQALVWYQRAAEQSHSLAQFNLAQMYAEGQGVPRNEAQSRLWMQRSAELGDAGAQHSMGMHFHRASVQGRREAAPESRIQAYKWLQLAAAQGYRGSAAASGFVTLHMTREDVTEAKRRVAAFVPAQPAGA